MPLDLLGFTCALTNLSISVHDHMCTADTFAVTHPLQINCHVCTAVIFTCRLILEEALRADSGSAFAYRAYASSCATHLSARQQIGLLISQSQMSMPTGRDLYAGGKKYNVEMSHAVDARKPSNGHINGANGLRAMV